jgi:hypothetical protein
MKKNKFLFMGMLALALTFTIVLTGCPDPNQGPTEAEKLATALAETLGADKAEASGTTVTLKAAVVRDAELTVPAGVTLKTGAFALTINDGVAFKVDGIVDVITGGALNLGTTGTGISESSYLKGTINVSGTLVDTKHGPKAAFWDADAAYYTNESTGEIVFKSGSTGTVNSDSTATGTAYSAGAMIGDSGLLKITDANATITLRATANSTKATYTLAGGAVALQGAGYTFTDSVKLLIAGTSVLSIPKDFTLTINGTLNVETGANVTGDATSTASKIIFGAGASSTGKAIFYPSGASASAGQAVASKTYNWSEHGDGSSGAAGWKATN